MKRGPKGDPNPQKGPLGDPGTLKGTHCVTVQRLFSLFCMFFFHFHENNDISIFMKITTKSQKVPKWSQKRPKYGSDIGNAATKPLIHNLKGTQKL